jgi:hypothetical protein
MSPMGADAGRVVTPRASHPGRMTAAMRATDHGAGRRVLRVALVVAGRIVEDRIVDRRTSVTVGPGEHSTFVVRAELPQAFKLFERTGATYSLNVLDTMIGRVAMGGEVMELVTLRTGAERAGSGCRILLTEDARGRVVIGETTFLFQFVAPRPAEPRPQLPLSIRGGIATQIDGRLAIIVAMSFLVHFGLLGAFYSDWMDSVVGDDITARFIDTLVQDRVPPPVDAQEMTTDASPTDPSREATATPQPTASTRTPLAGVRDAHALGNLLREAKQLEIGILGALQPGPNIARAIARESGPPVDLNQLAANEDGVTNRDPLLRGVGDTGPIAPRMAAILPQLTDAPSVPSTAGPPRRIALPATVQELPFSSTAHVSNAEATIRKQIEPGARRCYEKGLQIDPMQAGRLVLAIQVSANGEVDSANAVQVGGLSTTVAHCIAEVAKRAIFDRPAGGAALLQVPFNFVKQN